MNKNMLIATVATAVVLIVLIGSFFAYTNDRDDPDEPSIVDEWNLVSVYTGGWIGDVPVYTEDAFAEEKANIYPYNDFFYIFENEYEKLYCSWDGKKMVTSDGDGDTSVIFIMQAPENTNFLMAFYFDAGEAVIKLYQRQGYAGDFPGFSIPFDLPKIGEPIESFKNREYAPDGPVDHGKNTLTMRDVEGRMAFYDVLMDGDSYKFVSIYVSAGIFLSVGVCEDSYIRDAVEYRGDVLYCSSMDFDTGNTWVVEYGDESKAEYPDIDLSERLYLGSEQYLIFKDGNIVEQGYGNVINLEVLMQDDECVLMTTVDADEDEIAAWTASVNIMKPVYQYGISVQSTIEYSGVSYHGDYFGYFPDKKCKGLNVYGTLDSDDGYCIVISQKYTLIGQ